MVQDWKKYPYVDIEVADVGAECSEGTYPLFNNSWRGTFKGY